MSEAPITLNRLRKPTAPLADEAYRQLLIEGTFEPQSGLSPQQYRDYVEAELARWGPIVKAMGLKLD